MSNKKSIKSKENITIDSRLSILESILPINVVNLNRVCMQHDALMPMMSELP
jgi:hypothetical protein